MQRDYRKTSDDELINKLVMVAKVLESAHHDKELARKIAEFHEELETLKQELLHRLGVKTKGGAR